MSEGFESKANPFASGASSVESETRMDLGDDLLQTRTLIRDPSLASKPPIANAATVSSEDSTESVDELLLNSKILMGEGLLEDAKATLRKVMKLDPGNLSARDRLAEIQAIEIKRLLGNEEAERPSYLKSRKREEEQDPQDLLASLEKELGPGKDPEIELFGDEDGVRHFLDVSRKASEGASAQDRVDLGVAFLEMGLHEAAIAQLQEAAKDVEIGKKAKALLAFALLEKGSAYEAMVELESLIADQDASAEEKVDFGYMAGLAQEKLGNYAVAANWYRAVIGIEMGYRDAQSRLFRCLKKCEKSPSSSSSRS